MALIFQLRKVIKFMNKIFVAGHNGMVGSAICRILSNRNHKIITAQRNILDLTNQQDVTDFFKQNKFDQVYLAAAKVGGIYANSKYPAEFIYQNLMIQNNIIHASYKTDVTKLLFLGSSCIYPKLAKQPITEDELLNGHLESTNEAYAVAKIAGIKMCESYNIQYGTDFRPIMPTNLYGPGDNYHPKNSHVIPALIRRFHEAKKNGCSKVIVWGTGTALREFLYVDDMAEASIFVMNLDKDSYKTKVKNNLSHLNIGNGYDISIKDLANEISKIVGFKGKIEWDKSKPDGTPKKLLSIEKIQSMGWRPRINLHDGLKKTYINYLDEYESENKNSGFHA